MATACLTNTSLVCLSENEIQTRIVRLRNILEDDGNLKQINPDDKYLKRFLNSTHYNVEQAGKRLKMFHELLAKYPEFHTKATPLDKKWLIEKNSRILLDSTDKDGRPIYIVKLGNISPKWELIDVIAIDDIFMESIIDEQPIHNGICVLIDVANLPWQLYKWLTARNIKILRSRIESFPLTEIKYHVVNSVWGINVGINLIWPFVPEKAKDKIKFHFNNYETLKDFIDEENLPEEYGGKFNVDPKKSYEKLYGKNKEIEESFQKNRMVIKDI